MAGFQRFVTYLYKYENDKKQENTGFAKVEVRGGSCRLEVHVRNLNLEISACTVYLFARNEKIMQSVPVGELQIHRGTADMRYMFEEKNLREFGLTMDKMEGIFISISENLYIASQWKEGEIQKQFVRIQEKIKLPEREETQAQVQEQAAEETSHAQPQKEAEKTENEEPRDNNIVEEAKESPEVKQEQKESENLKATEIPAEKFGEEGSLEDAYQKLKLKLTVFFPFQGEEIECIKADITDIQELPRKYWYLGKNSFLLHGFFNYRHLVVGEIRKEEKREYFIGVPGIFQNQERIMAAMFGFPEFRTAEQTEYKTGNFGYWYRIM